MVSYFLFSERSGKKNKIKEAITGNINPITNHLIGFRPRRLAKKAVIKGILNKAVIPNMIKNAAPISILFETKLQIKRIYNATNYSNSLYFNFISLP